MAGCCECGNEPLHSIKYEEFSWIAEDLLASQEGLCSMESLDYVKCEVLSAVTMKNTVSWNVTPCSVVEICRRFGGTNYLHL
jgi:hypothetical protein